MSNDKVQMAVFVPLRVREILKDVYIEYLKNDRKKSYGDIISDAVLEKYAKKI